MQTLFALWITIHACAIVMAVVVRDEMTESKTESRWRLAAVVFGPAVLVILFGAQVRNIYRNAFPGKDPSLPKARVIRP